MSDVWNDAEPPAFTVGRVGGGDFVRGRPLERQNALRYKVHKVVRNTASDKIAVKSSLTAVPTDYGKVELSWAWPTAYKDWNEVSIVRSGFGHPSTVNDGMTVFRSTKDDYPFFDSDGTPLTITIEDTNLQPGRWAYYTVFFYINRWEPVMYAESLTPRNFDHYTHLWEGLPEYYRYVDSRFRGDQGFLQQFLRMFGFELDLTREYVETWQDVYHTDFSPFPLLRQVGLELGIGDEQGLGEIRTRALIGQVHELYDSRGTAAGLQLLVEAGSKYDTTVTMGRNLMLLPDDAEFVTGTGNWVLCDAGLNTRITSQWADVTATAYDPIITVAFDRRIVVNKMISSGVATLTTSVNHGFRNGDMAVVEGVDERFNGTYVITRVTPGPTTFTYNVNQDDVPSQAATGTVYDNSNALLDRGAAYSQVTSRAFDAMTTSTPTPREVTLTYLQAGVTTADYVPGAGNGVMVVQPSDAYGTGDVMIACGLGKRTDGTVLEPRFHGIPVEAETVYGFSAWFKAANTTSTVAAGIYWFGTNDEYLGRDFVPEPVSSVWQSIDVSAQSPVNTSYAIPFVSVSARGHGDSFSLMGCMFYEVGAGGTVTAGAPDRYLTLGNTAEFIGEASGKVMGG